MAINIKNDETERLTRALAETTGESVTTAVTVAVRERLDRVRSATPTESVDARTERILLLGRQIATSLGSDPMRIEDLYDDDGLPR